MKGTWRREDRASLTETHAGAYRYGRKQASSASPAQRTLYVTTEDSLVQVARRIVYIESMSDNKTNNPTVSGHADAISASSSFFPSPCFCSSASISAGL